MLCILNDHPLYHPYHADNEVRDRDESSLAHEGALLWSIMGNTSPFLLEIELAPELHLALSLHLALVFPTVLDARLRDLPFRWASLVQVSALLLLLGVIILRRRGEWCPARARETGHQLIAKNGVEPSAHDLFDRESLGPSESSTGEHIGISYYIQHRYCVAGKKLCPHSIFPLYQARNNVSNGKKCS